MSGPTSGRGLPKARRRRAVRPVEAAEGAVGFDAVTDHLLELLDVGEAAIALALPDQRVIEMNLEDAPRAGNEGHLANFEREGREHLLRHPSGAEQPVALRAVGDGETRLVSHTVGSPQLDMKFCGRTRCWPSSSGRVSSAVVALTRWARRRAICSSHSGWVRSTSMALSTTKYSTSEMACTVAVCGTSSNTLISPTTEPGVRMVETCLPSRLTSSWPRLRT